MADILVYTAVMGGYDALATTMEQGRYRCYTDRRAPWGWEERKEAPRAEPRRRARYWKTAGMPTDAEFTIWIDGNCQLLIPAQALVEAWLGEEHDIALFRHPAHDCIYQEARACKAKEKDEAAVIDGQMAEYRAAGFPEHYGLGETTILARRNCKAVTEFNARWWAEISQGSVRDQLSFDYVRWTMGDGIRVHFVDGGMAWRRREHPWFRFVPHRG